MAGARQNSTAQTDKQATATCFQSSSASGTYSEKARIVVPAPFGATWSAAIEIIASMMLGNLNANARANMDCENLKANS